MKWLLLLGCVVVLASARSFDSLKQQWENYKREYNKEYPNPYDNMMRMNIFAKNLDFIEEHNRKYKLGLVSYTVGLNNFSDMTNEEIKGFLGVITRKPKSRF